MKELREFFKDVKGMLEYGARTVRDMQHSTALVLSIFEENMELREKVHMHLQLSKLTDRQKQEMLAELYDEYQPKKG